MALRDSWHRALVYFGLAEERDPYAEEEDDYEPEAQLEDRYRERPNVRRLSTSRRRRDESAGSAKWKMTRVATTKRSMAGTVSRERSSTTRSLRASVVTSER